MRGVVQVRRSIGVVTGIHQRGAINIMWGAAVLVVAVVAAVLLERVIIPYFDAPKSIQAVNKYRFTPIAEMDEPGLEEWEGRLYCDSLRQWGPFERDKPVLVSSTVLARENGDTAVFYEATDGGTVVPAEMTERFEWWRGEIRDGKVIAEGWYTEGNDVVKKFSMEGSVEDGRLQMEGTRGPRDCSFEAISPAQARSGQPVDS